MNNNILIILNKFSLLQEIFSVKLKSVYFLKKKNCFKEKQTVQRVNCIIGKLLENYMFI